MTHPDRRPPLIPPCDLYSEQVHLLLDRELGPAEEALVEAHLQTCPHCQVLVNRLERMSSVLKAWDAAAVEFEVPSHRLQNAVQARVAEQSAFRRREGRRATLLQCAIAAVVVVGLGLGVLLGLQTNRGASPAVGSLALAASKHPADVRRGQPSPFRAPGLGEEAVSTGFVPGELAPIPASTAPAPSDVDLGVAAVPQVAFLVAHMDELEAFSERVGAPAIRLYIPKGDGRVVRLVTLEAWRFLRAGGALARWEESNLGTQGRPTVAPTPPAPPEWRDTGITAAAMLEQLPGIPSDVHALIRERALLSSIAPPRASGSRSAARPSLVRAFGIRGPTTPPLASSPLGGTPPTAFLDPLAAVRSGRLRFEAGRDDLGVTAFVRGTEQPIYIPAGQFVSGWGPDRVVAQPTWLPASSAERSFVIPCYFVAQSADVRTVSAPKLEPVIAGPTIRALLAAGAPPSAVKDAARRHVGARLRNPATIQSWADWSLLPLYGGPRPRESLELLRRGVRWKGEMGFVAVDAQDRLLGFEVLRVSGPAAEELLLRLWHSYAMEAFYRDVTKSADAFAPPAEGLAVALARLREHEASFQQPPGLQQGEEVRVSSLEVPAAGIHLHALEVGEAPVVLSGLSSVPTGH